MSATSEPPAPSSRSGLSYALATYLTWGSVPLYWKQLSHVPSTWLVSHRVLWSLLFVAVLLTASRRWAELLRAVRSPRTLGLLLLTTALVSTNWLLYIWAVNSGHMTQGSLGYYINPLVNVVLARLALGERLRPLQLAAVLLAAGGVLYFALGLGQVPWVSLVLASTFSLYGLLRKLAPVESLTGLAVETALAAPLAFAFLASSTWAHGQPLLGSTPKDAVLLLGSGAVTAIPLLWFAQAARRLRYTTLGIVQYLSPSLQLALAVLVYGEPFTSRHGLTFACIWSAVILYTMDSLWRRPLPAPARQAS